MTERPHDTAPILTPQESAVYGYSWNEQMRFMIDPISDDEARHRFETGGDFTVSVGQELLTSAAQSRAASQGGLTPAVPEFTIEVDAGDGSFSTYFYDDFGSIIAVYEFTRVEPTRLFVTEVVFYDYPDEPGYHDQGQAGKITTIRFSLDGTSHTEVDDTTKPTLDVVDRAEYPIDKHWEPYPMFGDWESLGRADRRPHPPSQPSAS